MAGFFDKTKQENQQKQQQQRQQAPDIFAIAQGDNGDGGSGNRPAPNIFELSQQDAYRKNPGARATNALIEDYNKSLADVTGYGNAIADRAAMGPLESLVSGWKANDNIVANQTNVGADTFTGYQQRAAEIMQNAPSLKGSNYWDILTQISAGDENFNDYLSALDDYTKNAAPQEKSVLGQIGDKVSDWWSGTSLGQKTQEFRDTYNDWKVNGAPEDKQEEFQKWQNLEQIANSIPTIGDIARKADNAFADVANSANEYAYNAHVRAQERQQERIANGQYKYHLKGGSTYTWEDDTAKMLGDAYTVMNAVKPGATEFEMLEASKQAYDLTLDEYNRVSAELSELERTYRFALSVPGAMMGNDIKSYDERRAELQAKQAALYEYVQPYQTYLYNKDRQTAEYARHGYAEDGVTPLSTSQDATLQGSLDDADRMIKDGDFSHAYDLTEDAVARAKEIYDSYNNREVTGAELQDKQDAENVYLRAVYLNNQCKAESYEQYYSGKREDYEIEDFDYSYSWGTRDSYVNRIMYGVIATDGKLAQELKDKESYDDMKLFLYGLDQMTEKEKQTYFSAYTYGGWDECNAYLDAIRPRLNERAANKEQKDAFRNFSKMGKVASTAAGLSTSILNPTKAITSIYALADSAIHANDPAYQTDFNSVMFQGNRAINNAREAARQNLDTKWGQGAYNIATSVLDNVVNRGIAIAFTGGVGGEALTSALMSIEIIGDTIMQEQQKGRNAKDSASIALVRAGIEYATEMFWDTEKFFENPFGSVQLLKQALAEGTEEIESNFLNDILDMMIADPEGLKAEYDRLVYSGVPKDVALSEIISDHAKQYGEDFLPGALSVLFEAGARKAGSTAINSVTSIPGAVNNAFTSGKRADAYAAENIQRYEDEIVSGMESNSIRETVRDEARNAYNEGWKTKVDHLANSETYKNDSTVQRLVKRAQSEIQNEGSVSNRTAYKIDNAIQAHTRNESYNAKKTEVINAITDQLTSRGDKHNILAKAKAIFDYAIEGKQSTQTGIIESSDTAQEIVEEISGAKSAEWVKDLKVNIAAMSNLADKIDKSASVATPDGNGTIQSMNGDTVTMKMEDGSTKQYKADALEIEDEQFQSLVDYAATKPAAIANAVYHAYISGQNISEYIEDANTVIDLAMDAFGSGSNTLKFALNTSLIRGLKSAQVRAIFYVAINSDERIAAQKKVRKERGEGKVSFRADVAESVRTDSEVQSLVDLLKEIAKITGIDYELFESKTDENGDFQGVNGSFNADLNLVKLDLNALRMNKNEAVDRQLILFTASHEMTHWLKVNSPAEYAELRAFIIDYLLQHKGQDSFDNAILNEILADKDSRAEGDTKVLSISEAIDELVARGCESMLSGSEMFTNLANENTGLAMKVRDWMRKFTERLEQLLEKLHAGNWISEIIRSNVDAQKEVQRLWDKALFNAISQSNDTDSDVEHSAVLENAKHMEFVNENGSDLHSYRTMKQDFEGYVEDMKHVLVDDKVEGFTLDDFNNTINVINTVMDRIEKQIAYDAIHGTNTASRIDTQIKGNPKRMTPYKQNADPHYKIALDFSTLCRKRMLQASIIDALQNELERGLTAAEQLRINQLLRKMQEQYKLIEIACDICYVEAARYKSPDYINGFIGAVKQEDGSYKFDEQVVRDNMRTYFAKKDAKWFAKQKMRIAEMMDKKIRSEGGEGIEWQYKANGDKKLPAKKEFGKYKEEFYSATVAVRAEYELNETQQKITDDAVNLPRSAFLTTDGLMDLATNHPEIYDAFTTFVREKARSKAIEGRTEYVRGDVVTLTGKNNQTKRFLDAQKESGTRMQSWSDFEIIHLLDYVSAVIELSRVRSKLHTYTKVPAFVRIFGNTGIMFNMSLVPHGDLGLRADGELDYDDIEGMVSDEAILLRDEFPETAGTILIGCGNNQIIKAMHDEFIDYIIPYHKSGMPEEMMAVMQQKAWTDYQDYQNESGGKVALSDWFSVDEWKKFKKANPEKNGYDFMNVCAQKYLDFCNSKNIRPKFYQFLQKNADGKWEFTEDSKDGFWKLLVDRKMVNQQTGDIIEQKSVVPKFNLEAILEEMDNALVSEQKDQEDEVRKKVIDQIISEGEEGFSEDIIKAAQQMEKNILWAEKNREEAGISAPVYNSPREYMDLRDDLRYNPRAIPQDVVKCSDEEALGLRMDDYRNVLRFREQVDDVLSGNSKTDSFVLLGKPSEILAKYMKSSGPLFITQSGILKGILSKGESNSSGMKGKHGLGVDMVYDLPFTLSDPVAISENTSKHVNEDTVNSIIVWTNWMTVEGYPIIVPIRIEIETSFGVVNAVITMFDIYNEKYLDGLLDEEKTVYTKNKKSIRMILETQRNMLRLSHSNASIGILQQGAVESQDGKEKNSEDLGKHAGRAIQLDPTQYDIFSNRDYASYQISEAERTIDYLNMLKDAKTTKEQEKALAHLIRIATSYEQIRNDARAVKTLAGDATFAQKLKAIEKLVKAEGEATLKNEALKERVSELIKQKRTEVAEANKIARERLSNYRNQRDERDLVKKYRKQAEKEIKKLTDMVFGHDDKVHVVEILQRPLAEFLKNLSNMEFSRSMMERGEETKKDVSLLETIRRLEESLAEQRVYDSLVDIPADFKDELEKLVKSVKQIADAYGAEGDSIYQLGSDDLKRLVWVVKTLRYVAKNANNLYENSRFASVYDAINNTKSYLDSLGQYQDGKMKGIKSWLEWANLNPYYAFKRFGKAGESIFEELQNGWDKLAFNAQKVIDIAQSIYTADDVEKYSSDEHTIELENGETITLTSAQAMYFYWATKREQALEHIQSGGIKIDDYETGEGRKKHSVKQSDHHRLQLTDYEKIAGIVENDAHLKEIADKLQNVMNTTGSDWGNEVSMKRFGYRAFIERNYVPIVTDNLTRDANVEKHQSADIMRLVHMSASHSTVPHANNALVVGNAFEVFSDHMVDMAKYNALVIPILDAMKWLNYNDRMTDEDGKRIDSTVRMALDKAYGTDAGKYIVTLLSDINGNKEGGREKDASAITRFFGNSRAAAVAGNLRVALLQPTAYLRAAIVLDPSTMAKAMAMSPKRALTEYEEARKHCGIFQWKSMGFRDVNISRSLRDQVLGNPTFGDKLREKSLIFAEYGDAITWGVIWKACKKTAAQQGYTGDELFKQAAKIAREVVYSSQVVDSTLTRSQAMRSDTVYMKGLTAFMSEPTLSYNLALDSYTTLENEMRRNGGDFKAAWKKHGNKVTRTLAVYVVSQIGSAIVESIADAMRDDDEYERTIEKWWQAFWGDKFFDGNLYNDLTIIGKIPGARDLLSLLQGYPKNDVSYEWLIKTVKCYNALTEKIALADGTQKKATAATNYGNMTLYGAMYTGMQALSSFTGLPIGNVAREISAGINDVVNVWNATIGYASPSRRISADWWKTYAPKQETSVRNAYAAGYMSDKQAVTALVNDAGFDTEKAESTVNKWAYQNLDKALESAGEKEANGWILAEDEGVSLDEYHAFYVYANNCSGENRKQDITDYIDDMDISKSAKRALYSVFYKTEAPF